MYIYTSLYCGQCFRVDAKTRIDVRNFQAKLEKSGHKDS